MMVEDSDGNYIATNKMSTEDRSAAASYVAFIMQEYRKLIPQDKQYGISISSMTETKQDIRFVLGRQDTIVMVCMKE